MAGGQRRYRMYVDESGDHTYRDEDDTGKRYLALVGVIIDAEYYRTTFHRALEDLKQDHFPHSPDEPVILHRADIVDKSGPFWRLRDPERRASWDESILRFFAEQQYRLIVVVIDKLAHFDRYGESAWHPYHHCMTALLERYAGWLNLLNARGDVIAETRGAKEDELLRVAYGRVYEGGTQFRSGVWFQRALTSKKLKIKRKQDNIAGLQVADLLAHPCKTEVLDDGGRLPAGRRPFACCIAAAVATRYNRRERTDAVEGYGKVFLK